MPKTSPCVCAVCAMCPNLTLKSIHERQRAMSSGKRKAERGQNGVPDDGVPDQVRNIIISEALRSDDEEASARVLEC